MKKLIYCAAALVTALFAGSCQKENFETAAEGNTVIYTVEVPDALLTKAIGDDVTKVDELVYEVYRTNGEKVETITEGVDRLLYHETAVIKNGKAIVPLELINNQNFTVLFWAHSKDNGVYDASNLTNVTITSPDVANNVNAQAFVGRDFVVNSVSAANRKVTLTRPVSQLNIGTTKASLTAFRTPITLAGSSVKVSGLSTSYNVAALSAGEATDVEYEYTETEVPTERLNAGSNEYIYVGMNYIGFAANEGSTIKVAYDINTSEGTITNKISNVPVKPNYRTNIVGNLITSTSNYTIELDKAWGTDGNGTMEVINNGVVRNVNGDYEVTNAEGLAFAMNNLFEDDGNFYLTEEVYNLSGFAVTPPVVPAGITINIYGETPVVTRAATTFAGITIIGLPVVDGTPTLIAEVENGGSVSVSGVTLEGDATVLVGKNNGTVIVYETTADTLVGDGNDPVAASEVSTIDELKAALDAGAEEIKLDADIEAEKVIEISKSVVINGNDYNIKSAANRVIRLTASNIKVVINDLNAISSAAVNYPNDVRGISVDPSLNTVDLTLNNCTVDFTDITTNDWTYAVNVSGSGTGHRVTVNGGSYEGANVINVHSAKNVITVKNAVLNCLYPFSEYYSGACIWVLQNQGSSVYAEGNTFNGNNAIAFNLGTGTALEEKDNIDNTMYYSNGIYYVTSVEKLQAAINNAKAGENTIAFSNDITGNVTVVQKPGVKITIDGCDKKYNGFIKVHSNSNHYADAALTIKNVNFETSTPALNFIEALENGSERYSTNITAENCSFTATDAAVNTTVGLQIKASKWAKALNCTATGVHSLIQAQSCDETVVVNGCTVNGKNGVAFKQVKAATVEGTTINALEYGIRFDGNTDNYGIVLKNNNVNAYQPLIVRKMTGANNTITLEGENTLTTDEIYQIVITNGSDDAAYVTPSGTYTLTGADDFVVYPRKNYGSKVSDGLYKKEKNYYVANAAGLMTMNQKFADKSAGRDAVLNLIRDIDFTGKTWTPVDSHADTAFEIAEINGNGHTISNLTINGQAMFTRFAGTGDVVVKDITFDNATVNSNGSINTSIVVGHTYQNVLFDNVDVKNSSITGGYKVAPLIGTVYNENTSTITANLKNCDVVDVTVKATSYDFCTTGMVAFVYAADNDTIAFEKCTVTNVKLYAPAGYTAHAAIYTTGSETLFNEAEGVTVTNVTFENI